MTSRRERIAWAALSAAVCWLTCVGALLAQSAASPTFAPAPEGFDTRRPGISAGRVERIEFPSSVRWEAAGDGLRATGLLHSAQIPGAVPAPRDRRQRDALDAVRGRRQHPRQSHRRQQGRADDRRDAQRAGVERAVDAICRAAVVAETDEERHRSAMARLQVRPLGSQAMAAAAGGPAARRWPSNSRRTPHSSASSLPISFRTSNRTTPRGQDASTARSPDCRWVADSL